MEAKKAAAYDAAEFLDRTRTLSPTLTRRSRMVTQSLVSAALGDVARARA